MEREAKTWWTSLSVQFLRFPPSWHFETGNGSVREAEGEFCSPDRAGARGEDWWRSSWPCQTGPWTAQPGRNFWCQKNLEKSCSRSELYTNSSKPNMLCAENALCIRPNFDQDLAEKNISFQIKKTPRKRVLRLLLAGSFRAVLVLFLILFLLLLLLRFFILILNSRFISMNHGVLAVNFLACTVPSPRLSPLPPCHHPRFHPFLPLPLHRLILIHPHPPIKKQESRGCCSFSLAT